jgi:streptogramin lyase
MGGQNGSVWMSAFETMRVLEVDVESGELRVHDLRDAVNAAFAALPGRWRRRPGELRRLHADAAGGIWFTDLQQAALGGYVPANGEVTVHPSFDASSGPYGITITSGGLVWFGESRANRVGVLDPVADRRRYVDVPSPGVVRHLVIDERRRRAWLPLSDLGAIGLIEYR